MTVRAQGYAVLKDAALIGYLTPDEARGANLLLNLPGEALYVLPDGQGGSVTVELLSQSAELSPVRDREGALTLEARLAVRAGIVEVSGAGPLTSDALTRLELSLAEAVRDQAAEALRRSRDMNADFLELYRALRAGVERESFLPSLSWRLTAEAVLDRSYDIQGGAHGGEEGSGHGG